MPLFLLCFLYIVYRVYKIRSYIRQGKMKVSFRYNYGRRHELKKSTSPKLFWGIIIADILVHSVAFVVILVMLINM